MRFRLVFVRGCRERSRDSVHATLKQMAYEVTLLFELLSIAAADGMLVK